MASGNTISWHARKKSTSSTTVQLSVNGIEFLLEKPLWGCGFSVYLFFGWDIFMEQYLLQLRAAAVHAVIFVLFVAGVCVAGISN